MAPILDEPANRLITLVSIMSSIFTLVLALIESMNDYKMKAHHMHACALSVNDLLPGARASCRPPTSPPCRSSAGATTRSVRGCPVNHARIDYLMARADRSGRWETKAWAHLRYVLDVYGLYGAFLLGPPLVLLFFA